MAFWKQSDDPWDRKADKRFKDFTGSSEPRESPVDTLKTWSEQRKAAAKEKEEARRLPPEKCPWCGKDMAQGFLFTGRDPIRWYPGIYKTAWFSRDRTGSFRVDNDEGALLQSYKITWLCRDCKKMVFNAPDPEDGSAAGNIDETKEEEESGK